MPFFILEILIFFFYQSEGFDLQPNPAVIWMQKFGYFHFTVFIQYGTYLLLTLVILRRYSRRLQEVFSTLDQIKLTWLRDFTWLAIFVVSIYGAEYLLLLLGVGVGDYFSVSSILMVVYVYAMVYMGLAESNENKGRSASTQIQ